MPLNRRSDAANGRSDDRVGNHAQKFEAITSDRDLLREE
jgi:hypothetical protein